MTADSGFDEKLDHLETLEDGWDGYKGHAITSEAMATARNLTVCPTQEGGLQIELHAGGVDVEICIASDGFVQSVYSGR